MVFQLGRFLGVTLGALAFGVVSIAAQANDPIVGTWKLDVARSTYKPGPAPKSTTLVVTPQGKGIKVDVDIVNDGVRSGADLGDPGGGAGFGLPGLRERAAHVGGTLEAGPIDGRKWAVRASLPARAAQPAATAETEDHGR